jgi:hypothetical protein
LAQPRAIPDLLLIRRPTVTMVAALIILTATQCAQPLLQRRTW